MVNGDPFGAAVESMSKEEVESSAELGAQGNLAQQGETCESRGEPKRCQASLALPGGARMSDPAAVDRHPIAIRMSAPAIQLPFPNRQPTRDEP
jgi:hypothetical protein